MGSIFLAKSLYPLIDQMNFLLPEKGSDTPPTIGFSGNITKDDLQGPLKGKEISDLVSLMSNGSAYVNAHTDKYPKGATRGQISSGESEAQAMTTTEAGNMTGGNGN